MPAYRASHNSFLLGSEDLSAATDKVPKAYLATAAAARAPKDAVANAGADNNLIIA